MTLAYNADDTHTDIRTPSRATDFVRTRALIHRNAHESNLTATHRQVTGAYGPRRRGRSAGRKIVLPPPDRIATVVSTRSSDNRERRHRDRADTASHRARPHLPPTPPRRRTERSLDLTRVLPQGRSRTRCRSGPFRIPFPRSPIGRRHRIQDPDSVSSNLTEGTHSFSPRAAQRGVDVNGDIRAGPRVRSSAGKSACLRSRRPGVRILPGTRPPDPTPPTGPADSHRSRCGTARAATPMLLTGTVNRPPNRSGT